MSETPLERAVSFFRNPERCRQNYPEAWQIGKAVFDDRELLRARIAALEQENKELSSLLKKGCAEI